jgi:hypothetical protein
MNSTIVVRRIELPLFDFTAVRVTPTKEYLILGVDFLVEPQQRQSE